MGIVKAVTKYETTDGQIHDSIEKARKHEALHDAYSKVKTALAHSNANFSMGTLHIELVNKPEVAEELRDALNRVLDVHRRYGKLKKPAAKV